MQFVRTDALKGQVTNDQSRGSAFLHLGYVYVVVVPSLEDMFVHTPHVLHDPRWSHVRPVPSA